MSDRENNGVDDELSLPKATVMKVITETLPSDIACSKDTRDLIIECCVEFIHLLASVSNEACEKETKKTIAAEHTLHFDDFIPEIEEVLKDHKQEQKSRDKKASRLENSGMSEEELLKMQQQIFASAKMRYESQGHQP